MMFPRNAGKAEKLQGFDWMCDFVFGVEVLSRVKALNLKLQGKNAMVHELYSHVFKANPVCRNISQCWFH